MASDDATHTAHELAHDVFAPAGAKAVARWLDLHRLDITERLTRTEAKALLDALDEHLTCDAPRGSPLGRALRKLHRNYGDLAGRGPRRRNGS